MDEVAITKREEAYILHNRILTNGKIIQTALIDVCRDLKQMRDQSLYLELGYDSFEDYSEKACGIKQRQAYSYISAYEKLGSDFIKENSELGITKLELIAQVSSFERDEFLEGVNIEDISTRELKEEIAKYKAETEQLTLDLKNVRSEKEASDDEIAQLKIELQQAKEAPKDVIVGNIVPDDEAIKSAVDAAVKKLKSQLKDAKAKNKAVERAKAEAVKLAEESATKAANEKIDKLLAEKNEKDAQLQEALKAAKISNADEDTIAIRILFNNLQSTANEIREHIKKIKVTDEEKAVKLITAMKSVLHQVSENI
ncbi:MAG: hypothetical protein ACLUFN_07655 [Eubacterium sp.]